MSGGAATLIKQKELGVLGMGLKVFKEEGGVRALYKGIGPTTAGVAPYVAFNFTFYELLKIYFTVCLDHANLTRQGHQG
jgi:solute carrier family 25 phosphate transporter 23/24/25/41